MTSCSPVNAFTKSLYYKVACGRKVKNGRAFEAIPDEDLFGQ
jgi:hypothetical protein